MTISLSVGVRAALNSLQNTSFLAVGVQNRLASGKKVNSALDNPRNFFVASGLSSRASDLTNLLDDIGLATKVIDAANNGITGIQGLVDQAKATLSQIQQSAATTASVNGTVTGLTASQVIGGSITAGNTITFNDGTSTGTFTATAASTVQNVLDAVNNTAGLKIKASLASDGHLVLEATSNNTIVIGGTSLAAEKATIGLVAATTAAGTVNTTRTALAAQFDSLRTQIDQLSGDAGFNGTNLLSNGSLKVLFNETSTSSLAISGVNDTSTGLGVTASTNSFQTSFDINAALANVTTASTTLRTQASTFGANLGIVTDRQTFIKSMVATLNAGSDLLTLADTNEEGANLLALQTRQQLSQTALGLAAQADASILKIL